MKTLFFHRAIIALLIAIATPLFVQETAAQGVKVIVIDPGHGGKFPGAAYGGHLEKDINLKVALRLGELIKKGHPKIKVVYTRTTDIALGSSLNDDLGARNRIANEANGDLFISIHANASKNPQTKGVETLIMGETPLERQRNDAALYSANQEYLIDMSNEKTAAIVRAYIQNLQFTYGQYSEALARLIQKNYGKHNRVLRPVRGQPIKVLYGTDMPCVLTEVGFMTNKEELAYITSAKGREEIAQSIYNGINEYIAMVGRTSNSTNHHSSSTDTLQYAVYDELPDGPTDSQVKIIEQPKAKEDKINGYTIQIMSSNYVLLNNDPQFKSYAGKQFHVRTEGGRFRYKYCVGKYRNYEEAQKNLATVRKQFKDAFITTY